MNTKPFSTLNLPEDMLETLTSLNYIQMTPIQEKSLPYILKGDDLIAQAKTGSGKTAAFGIGVLLKLNVRKFNPQVVVLCPTRELADQVAKELRRLARFKHNIKILTLSGGMPMRPQMNSLEHGAHIVVGTPGRIQDHLSKGTLELGNIKVAVLDEADRMLDMGFYDEIKKIVSNTSKERQTLLFSATFQENIKVLSKEITDNPVQIQVESKHTHAVIREFFYESKEDKKVFSLLHLLKHYQPKSVLVFCNTKIKAQELSYELQNKDFSALALHGDLEQIDRNEVLLQFANKSCSVLIATDVAARGLDIKEIDAVINYDAPRDKETYIHRIGRTGRAGHKGLALTLYAQYERGKIGKLQENDKSQSIQELKIDENFTIKSPMITLCINGGKKDKLRPGDILGALTGKIDLDSKQIGKIDIFDFYAYVAVDKEIVNKAFKGIQNGKIKKRSFKVWKLL